MAADPTPPTPSADPSAPTDRAVSGETVSSETVSGGDPSNGQPGPSARAPIGRPGRPPGSAGLGSVSALAFGFILVPGMAAYVILHAVGLAIGPAGLLGLLVMFVCLGFYPSLLLRLGWVPPRRKRQP